MKKIINGKLYDTETAKRVGEWNNGCYGNFNYCAENLYRKRTGEFFLYGYGGPMSKYAESAGNNCWTDGCAITPLTYDAAKQWAEEHLTADEYEAIFGPVMEDESKNTLTLYMTATAIEKAKRAASQAGVSLSSYIESLISKENGDDKE